MKRLLVLLALLLAAPALADETPDHAPAADRQPYTPHFAALRSDEVNMRTGPGTRYPITWVYRRKGLPMEIVAEYDIWRRVRDSDGTEGWVNKVELTGKRAVVVTADAATPVRELRDDADANAAIDAHLQPGAVGLLLSCADVWCRVKFDGIKGYLPKSDFWGAYPAEKFN